MSLKLHCQCHWRHWKHIFCNLVLYNVCNRFVLSGLSWCLVLLTQPCGVFLCGKTVCLCFFIATFWRHDLNNTSLWSTSSFGNPKSLQTAVVDLFFHLQTLHSSSSLIISLPFQFLLWVYVKLTYALSSTFPASWRAVCDWLASAVILRREENEVCDWLVLAVH